MISDVLFEAERTINASLEDGASRGCYREQDLLREIVDLLAAMRALRVKLDAAADASQERTMRTAGELAEEQERLYHIKVMSTAKPPGEKLASMQLHGGSLGVGISDADGARRLMHLRGMFDPLTATISLAEPEEVDIPMPEPFHLVITDCDNRAMMCVFEEDDARKLRDLLIAAIDKCAAIRVTQARNDARTLYDAGDDKDDD
jgi:hypothetical protein